EAALEKKDYPRAEKLFKQVLAANDKNPRAWFYLGSVYAATDRKTEAIAALEKSVALKPQVFESNLNLGLLLASVGKNEQADSHLSTATQLKPSNQRTADQDLAYAWMSLGRLRAETSPDRALVAFAAAARLTPKSPDPHLESALLLAKQREYGEAEREYRQALALSPASGEALAGLVRVFIEQKRLPEAEAMLHQYIAANQGDAAAHKLLGEIHVAQQRFDDAMTAFSEALKITPSDRDTKRELANAAALGKKYDVAERLYGELAQAQPNDADIRFARGTLFMNQRKFPQAEAELIQAVKLDPKLAEGYGNLAFVASENQHYELALKALETRAQFVPDNAGTYFL